jgi:hypothetical protein
MFVEGSAVTLPSSPFSLSKCGPTMMNDETTQQAVTLGEWYGFL